MDLNNEIPYQLAYDAHRGTSWTPEDRAKQEQDGFAALMETDYNAMRKHAETGGTLPLLEGEFARYRAAYAERTRRYLASRTSFASAWITGPSKYPAARMEKRHRIIEKRLAELIDFRNRALDAMRRTLRPELRPIMAGDSDAADRLREKIALAETAHAIMKATNDAHKRYLKDPSSLDSSDLNESLKATIRAYKPAYSWEPHPVAPYQLTNSSANIRRMKERLAEIETAQTTPATSAAGTAARLEDCPAENRIRLFFPGKPSEEIRATLKRNGFRWTPTLGCWQAYRNHNAIETARKVAGIAGAV